MNVCEISFLFRRFLFNKIISIKNIVKVLRADSNSVESFRIKDGAFDKIRYLVQVVLIQ